MIEATSVARSVVAIGKRVVLGAVGFAWSVSTRAQAALVGRRAGAGPIVVLDIDNTIADSWPSFAGRYPSERARLASLPPLPNIKAVAHDQPLAAGATVVFLSHRHPWEWSVTYRWLRRHGFDAHWWNVLLVPSAMAKVPYLRRFASGGGARGRAVTVWDDLSRAHETGAIVFYDEVLELVRGISLTSYGWADIVAVTGLGLDRETPGRG